MGRDWRQTLNETEELRLRCPQRAVFGPCLSSLLSSSEIFTDESIHREKGKLTIAPFTKQKPLEALVWTDACAPAPVPESLPIICSA